MDLLVLTQYFDALQVHKLGALPISHLNPQEIGNHPKTKTVFLSADGNPIRNGVLEADSSR
jgi:hypothetical protein